MTSGGRAIASVLQDLFIAKQIETEQDLITQSHEQLAVEHARFKAVAIALNTKLDRKVRTADVLFNREQQFDKAVYRRRFRNRLNVLFELTELAAITSGLGFWSIPGR
ncbi:MAG: hypothetical protein WCD18_18645 [Thermosynechococcaceae cyanobacterium]